jgi:hypothetical protein
MKFVKALILLWFVVASLVSASATTVNSSIIGQLATPTGGAIVNGTLTFQISQPALIPGSVAIVPQSVSCSTTQGGSVVGVPDPLALPIVSTNTSTGSLSAATYYIKIAYTTAAGVTLPSPEQAAVLSGTGELIITAPAIQPSGATGYNVYIGASSGAETLQGSVVGWGQFTQSTSLSAGSSPSATNTTTCYLAFSDSMVPTGTYYTVTLTTQNGSVIAGYPQTWCTYGGLNGTINISNGTPSGNCGLNGVYYPTLPSLTENNFFTGTNTFENTVTITNGVTCICIPSGELVWTGTQQNTYLGAELGGATTGFEFNKVQSEINNLGSLYGSDASAGVTSVPSGATTHAANALAGYAVTSANSQMSGNDREIANAIGVYGQARIQSGASHGAVWGMNAVAADDAGATNSNVTGLEVDIGVFGSPRYVVGHLISAPIGTGTLPAGSPALWICCTSTTPGFNLQWGNGIIVDRGMIASGGSALSISGSCLSGGVPCGSETITLNGFDGSNVQHTASLAADSTGDLVITPPSGAVTILGKPRTFSTLPACSSALEGSTAPVTDSTTATWGATITGSGADHVLAYCDGTNWTVMGK